MSSITYLEFSLLLLLWYIPHAMTLDRRIKKCPAGQQLAYLVFRSHPHSGSAKLFFLVEKGLNRELNPRPPAGISLSWKWWEKPEAGIILLDHWADVRKGMSKYIEQISTERPTHSQQILTSDCPRKKTQSSCIHLATNHHAYISCPISTLQIQPSVVGHINTYHTWGVSSW